jgi:3-hydroxyisobutyrate dehydrogenase-like beta-hydroxyacid dehydrogenase
VEAGLRLVDSPRAVAAASDVIFTMVTDPAALEAVSGGADGLLAGLRSQSVLVDMSTVSPEASRALAARVAERGGAMLAAPVSGSPITLEAGQLSFMVGGDPAVLDRVRPYLAAIGPTITHVGEIGLATTMKIATNLGLAVQMLAFAEAVALAEKAGVSRERAVEALLRSVIASPMVKYRGPFVLGMPEEALFDVPMMQKDLGLAVELGRSLGVPLPTTAVVQEWMTGARGLGLGHFDFAVVFDVVAALSGLAPTPKPR